ncbi:MAG TPA: MauE/DoxX family redox-associated membrane protein [Acidimicrobiales bacterium]|nr:MauE/DoxX family redox-associated membrane protein [Acidimicrobiales bacterium]
MSSAPPASWRPHAGRWALGVILLAMAAGQLADPAGFVDVVNTYRLGGTSVSLLVAGTLIAGEAGAGIGLLSGRPAPRRRAATLAVAVAVAWSALALQAFARGLALDNCGCFGVYAAQPLRWWILLEDAYFVAFAVWVRRRLVTAGPKRPRYLARRVAGVEPSSPSSTSSLTAGTGSASANRVSSS